MSAVTRQELVALRDLAHARRGRWVAIGGGRTPEAVAFADAFASLWEETGGEVVETVAWPETAASWLRHARRFAETDVDLWIMTGPPAGWARMVRRLLRSTRWRPERTLVTSDIGDRAVLELAGADDLDGLAGADALGASWFVEAGKIVR
ncbi:hypothetical protein ACFYY8_24915 [Streptosporangium sp. NPDC001559]|uniref:hypothetical protein n=1 Tax=Streptosporangium sp. NPDC001559 TaxID=3366187 RepID=UPI0036E01E6A